MVSVDPAPARKIYQADAGTARAASAPFLHRVVTIMRLLMQQIHVLETMTAADFLKLLDRLEPASGFESLQLREIEFLVGLRDTRYIVNFAQREAEVAALKRRYDEPSVRGTYYEPRSTIFSSPTGPATSVREAAGGRCRAMS